MDEDSLVGIVVKCGGIILDIVPINEGTNLGVDISETTLGVETSSVGEILGLSRN